MKVDLFDPALVRKLAGLAIDNHTTPQKLAVVLLKKALETAPEPLARVCVTPTTGRATATQRHGDELLAVLLDQPNGMTYRGVQELFGWSKATVTEVLRRLRAEGLVRESYQATGGAPALVFHLAESTPAPEAKP